jgi:hypothetical protein
MTALVTVPLKKPDVVCAVPTTTSPLSLTLSPFSLHAIVVDDPSVDGRGISF